MTANAACDAARFPSAVGLFLWFAGFWCWSCCPKCCEPLSPGCRLHFLEVVLMDTFLANSQRCPAFPLVSSSPALLKHFLQSLREAGWRLLLCPQRWPCLRTEDHEEECPPLHCWLQDRRAPAILLPGDNYTLERTLLWGISQGEEASRDPKTNQTYVSCAPNIQSSLGGPSWPGVPRSGPVCTKAQGSAGQGVCQGQS